MSLVAMAMSREIGPTMTAIMVAGRSGSAFAAEIGTMKVTEELDAYEAMGLSSVRFLVVPKYLAMLVIMPGLTDPWVQQFLNRSADDESKTDDSYLRELIEPLGAGEGAV